MRDAVGKDVDIILEIHSLLGANSAIQLARAVEDIGIYYYEEPTNPMNTDAFARVTNSVSMPVSTGERNYTRWGYRELLEKQAVAVIQPDACLVGGITEAKKFAIMQIYIMLLFKCMCAVGRFLPQQHCILRLQYPISLFMNTTQLL